MTSHRTTSSILARGSFLASSPAYRFEMSKNPSGSWPPPIHVSRHPDSNRSENAAGGFRGALNRRQPRTQAVEQDRAIGAAQFLIGQALWMGHHAEDAPIGAQHAGNRLTDWLVVSSVGRSGPGWVRR